MRLSECIIKDRKRKVAGKDARLVGVPYTMYTLDCRGKEVVLAVGEKEGKLFMDVKEEGAITRLSGKNAIEYLLKSF